jgi:ribosomal protein S27E
VAFERPIKWARDQPDRLREVGAWSNVARSAGSIPTACYEHAASSTAENCCARQLRPARRPARRLTWRGYCGRQNDTRRMRALICSGRCHLVLRLHTGVTAGSCVASTVRANGLSRQHRSEAGRFRERSTFLDVRCGACVHQCPVRSECAARQRACGEVMPIRCLGPARAHMCTRHHRACQQPRTAF